MPPRSEDSSALVTLSGVDLGRLLDAASRGQRVRLAQDPAPAAAGPDPTNRLLSIPVRVILDRLDILRYIPRWGTAAPTGEFTTASMQDLLDAIGTGLFSTAPKPVLPPQVPEPYRSELRLIERTATPVELADLGLIDEFFGPDWLRSHGAHRGFGINKTTVPALDAICGSGSMEFKATVAPFRTRVTKSPFFCSKRPSGIFLDVGSWFTQPPFTNSITSYFALDPSLKWGDLRAAVFSVLNFMKLLKSYPFPEIANLPTGSWLLIEQEGNRKLVREPGPLTQDVVRFFVTMSLAANWNELFARAKDYIEDKAKREKFKMVVLAVGLSVFGAVLGWAIASALIVKGWAAAAALFTDQQKKEAAEGLKSLAGQLTGTEPGFAGQLAWTSEYIESLLLYPDRPEAAPAPPEASTTGSSAVQAAIGLGLPTLLSVGISALARS